jgi:hypothetical protein
MRLEETGTALLVNQVTGWQCKHTHHGPRKEATSTPQVVPSCNATASISEKLEHHSLEEHVAATPFE